MSRLHPAFSMLPCDKDGLPEVLKSLPNTNVLNFFRGLDTLGANDRSAAVGMAINHANRYIDAIIHPSGHARPTDFESIGRIRDLGFRACDPKGISLKLLKQLVGVMRSTKPGAKRMLGDFPVDPDLIHYVDGFETVTAPQMKKELNRYFGDRFGFVPKKLGCGDWLYSSPSREVRLRIDFGGTWGQQLRYYLSHSIVERMSFELIWGVGVGNWDFIHQRNLQESLKALGDICDFFENLVAGRIIDSNGEKQPK